MSRRVVQVEVAFLYVLTVIAFRSAESEEPLFKKRIAAVPHGHSETDELMPVAEASDAILIPAIRTRPRLIVGEITPGIALGAVVLANRTPRPFAQVRSPTLPVDFAILVFDEAFVFFAHERRR